MVRSVHSENKDTAYLLSLLLSCSKNEHYKKKTEKLDTNKKTLIKCLAPPNMSSTFNCVPEISLTLNQINNFTMSMVEMYLDNEIVTPIVNSLKISYVPLKKLGFCEHFVKIIIKDSFENLYEIKWSFLIENPNVQYEFFYGIPHAHTCYSDGKGTPLNAFEYARSKGLHYLIVADHSNFLDGVKNKNYEFDRATNQYIEKENSQWYKTRIEAEIINNKYNDFLALRGFEMSSRFWGHINIINSCSYVEGKKQIKNIKDFFNWQKKQQDIVISINHPDRSFNKFDYIPEMNGVVNLIEVGNGAFPRKYRRTEKYYFEALDLGWHLGAINGQDNHIDNWGDNDNLTVIIAESLTKKQLIEALKRRRTYSTETRSLRLIFKANDYWMGSIIPLKSDEILSFSIAAEDMSVPIERVQLITNGGEILCEKLFNAAHFIKWEPSVQAQNKDCWYVTKIIHSNGRWGISSPIFTKSV